MLPFTDEPSDGDRARNISKLSAKCSLLQKFNEIAKADENLNPNQRTQIAPGSPVYKLSRKRLCFDSQQCNDEPAKKDGDDYINHWMDSISKGDGIKHQKVEHPDYDIKTSESLKGKMEPLFKGDSKNLLSRWRKGDKIFKDKFSSGITPKITRPILKSIMGGESKKYSRFRPERESINFGSNPFISITPQISYKTRAISFNHEDASKDESLTPKSSKRTLMADTPAPNKTLWRVPNFDEFDNSDDENDKLAQQWIKECTSRGSRFEEDFEEISTVGRGHFGSVVRCKNKLDGIEYAIKITDKNTPKHGNSMVEALQEVYALSALSVSSENPYIVRYYRGWIENSQLFIQMELCDRSLAELFDDQNYDEKEIFKLLRQICLGLNELHEKGIVHLDLKLENILISTSGKYKLGDLGFSRLMNKLSHDVPEGDSRYLAKELLNTDAEALPDLRKADIFSLGILAYELVERRRVPSNGPEWHDLREGRIKFSDPSSTSPEIKEMVLKMLSANPDDRPTTSSLLKEHLMSEQEKELKMSRSIIKGLIMNQLKLNKKLSELKKAGEY